MTLITDTQALADVCGRLKGEKFLTVDTEFMREKTYWPQLCLVQVAGTEEAVAIDPLAPGIDLAPLLELMADTSILKVFHAARQDLEIFFHLSEAGLPTPIFDTQVAAMVCGFGDSVGYETLVNKLAKARIDKSSRFTDWSARPLSDRQIQYALSDVTHLRVIYQKLAAKLERTGRAHWLEEEMATLTADETYQLDPRHAWRRIKARGAHPRMLAVLREVAAWREREAQRRDLPRNRLLRDEALVEIAHHTPADTRALERTRGLGKRMAEGPMGKQILDAVAAGKAVPESEWPKPPSREPLPRGIGPLTDLLKVMLKMRCEESEVAQKLIANVADVERLAAYGEDADVAALHGWRREVFGEDALKLRAGEMALAATPDGVRVVPVSPEDD